MAFHFKYAAMLRLQRGELIQEEQSLLRVAARIASFRLKLEQLETSHREWQQALHSDLAMGGIAAFLQFSGLRESAIADVRKQTRKELESAQQQHAAQLLRYREASRKLDVLESLRDAEQSAYERDVARLEQRTADELYLAQLNRKPDE